MLGFGAAIAIGTLLLMLPGASTAPGRAPLVTALFTATSATCVTGLATVDTATYWTPLGQLVILALIQVGGFGIMTTASLLALLLSRRLGVRTRMTAAAETKSTGLGDIRGVLLGVVRTTVVVESLVAVALYLRWWLGLGESPARAAQLAVFHAVSSFNNAGFALFSDNLVGYVDDPYVCLPICVSIVVGGLGFPVILELVRRTPSRRWSLNTRLTLLMTGLLLVGGTAFLTLAEWDNPGTVGDQPVSTKLLAGFFHAVQARTAGFNAWDYGAVTQETLLGTIMLMFVGGGPAGTAGGIKVTTFVLLLFVIAAEVRGEPTVSLWGRSIDPRTYRQALTVALLAVAAVVAGTMIVTQLTDLPLAAVLFEVTSAFGTVGLSTGITPRLDDASQVVIVILMFLGRLGPTTLVSALAMRERTRRYEYPEGRPLIG